MPFTVTNFHDLGRFLHEHSDWRTELRRVLLSQDLFDLPRAVQELAVAQRRTEEAITHLTERMERGLGQAAADRQEIREHIEYGFTNVAEDRQRIRERMEQGFTEAAIDRRDLRRDIGQLKGVGQEQFYRDRAAAIFGRLLAQRHDWVWPSFKMAPWTKRAGKLL